MAFGDPIQSKSNGGEAASATTVTLDATATSGNLLVGIVNYRADRTGGAAPTGWTLDFDFQRSTTESGAAVDQTFFYKISDGTETAATFTITSTGYLAAAIHEYEGPWPADPTDVNSSADTGAGNAKTLATGATGTTAVADSVAISIGHNEDAGVVDDAWSDSFTIRESNQPSGSAMVSTADKLLSATGTVETTFSYSTGIGKHLTASVAVYSGVVAAVYPPFPRRQNTLVRM